MRTLLVAITSALVSTTACGDWKPDVTDGTLSLTVEGSPPLPTRAQPRAPVLTVECRNGKVKLYLDARTPILGPGDEIHEHRFLATYDDGRPEPLTGALAKPSDPLFFPRPTVYVKRLLDARTLTLEVTAYQFLPATTTFQVAGLGLHKELIEQHCRIK